MGKDRWLIIAAFATTYFVWGSTYLANYWAIATIPPFGMCAVRFTTAGLLMYAYTLVSGPRPEPTRTHWINSGIIGVLFLSVGTGSVVWATQYVPTSTAALIIAFEPLVVMFIMWGVLDNRPPAKAFVGAAISIVGMGLLVGKAESLPGAGAYKGVLAIACGMLGWASGMLLRSRLDLGPDNVRSTGMQMLIGGLVIFPFSLLMGEWDGWSIDQVSLRSFLAWSYLVVFGAIIAFSAFNYLLQRMSAEKVATNTYVNPVVAIVLGGLFNNEIITGQAVLAGVVLLTGVYFINSATATKS